MIVTIGLTIGFGKSDNLASAFGVAVSSTMLTTTILLFIAMHEIWYWNLLLAGCVAGVFMIVDGAFFLANLVKVADGGYVPLTFAVLIYGIMWIWHKGAMAVDAHTRAQLAPIKDFMQEVRSRNIPRVPGTAVFLTRTVEHTPPVMLWHVRHNRALHQEVIILRIATLSIPWSRQSDQMTVAEVAPTIWRAEARYGFMESPDVPSLMQHAQVKGCTIDLNDLTYYIGHETVIHRDEGWHLPHWQEAIFETMERNAAHLSDLLKLPTENVVEIGRLIAI
jgi:KUP system potassium uptake protein